MKQKFLSGISRTYLESHSSFQKAAAVTKTLKMYLMIAIQTVNLKENHTAV